MALAEQPLPRLELSPFKHDDLIIELSELPSIAPSVLTVQECNGTSNIDARPTNHITTVPATTTTGISTTNNSLAIHASATSILLKPTLFSIQKIHVSPDMCMNEELRAVWLGQIKEPLRIVLGHEISTGSCVQEFMMAGKTSAHFKPTVVVTCGNVKVRKQVEKVFKTQGWLRDVLKAHRIAFVALIHPAHLSVDEPDVLANESHDAASFYFEEHQDAAWLCGRRIKLENERTCVLGGVILLDDVPYALTAGHCFSHLDSAEQSAEIDSSLNDLDDDEEPFWFDSEDESTGSSQSSLLAQEQVNHSDNGVGSQEHSSEPTMKPPSAEDSFERAIVPTSWTSTLVNAEVNVATSLREDWAMLRFDSLSETIPNMIPDLSNQPARQVSTFATKECEGNVEVIFARHIYSGTLHASPCTVQIDSYSCTAYLITMSHILPLGCSGSWVVVNDQLVGHIIATREDIPWAYMIPIQSILESITAIYGPTRIDLPSKIIAPQQPTPNVPVAPLSRIEPSTSPTSISRPPAVPNFQSFPDTVHQSSGWQSHPLHKASSFTNLEPVKDNTDNGVEDEERRNSIPTVEFPDTPLARTIGIIVSLLLGLFIIVLDGSMVASIQPSILQDITQVSRLPWISVGYALGACAMNFVVSYLLVWCDHKWMFIIGLVFFEVGSAVSASAGGMYALISGRVISGMASDVVCVSGINIASCITTTKKSFWSIGLAGITSSLPVFLGPLLGGAFAQNVTWRWCFYLNLSLGGLSIPGSIFLLPSLKPSTSTSLQRRLRAFDWYSNYLFAAALTFSAIALCFGGNIPSQSSAQIITFSIIAGAHWFLYLLRLYLIQKRRLTRDFINPFSMLRYTSIMGLFVQTAAGSATKYIVMYFIPMYLQFVKDQTVFASAVSMLPFLGTFVYATGASIFLTNHFRHFMPFFLSGGALIVAGGSLLYTRFSPDMGNPAFYGFSVLCGVGVGSFLQPAFTFARLISREPDMADRYVDVIRCGELLGTLFGLAISNTIFLNKAAGRIMAIVQGISLAQAQDLIQGVKSQNFREISDQDVQGRILGAISQSMGDVFAMVIAAGAVIIWFAMFMRQGKIDRFVDEISYYNRKAIRYR